MLSILKTRAHNQISEKYHRGVFVLESLDNRNSAFKSPRNKSKDIFQQPQNKDFENDLIFNPSFNIVVKKLKQ